LYKDFYCGFSSVIILTQMAMKKKKASGQIFPEASFCYCSRGCVPRGVLVRVLHENPGFYGAKRRFLPFLCIAKRVIIRRTPLFGGV